MRLFIGGRNQGKTECCLARQNGEYRILDGAELPAEIPAEEGGHLILNRLQLWVQRCVRDGADPIACMQAFLADHPDADLLCDEVGNGIVPIDPFEREWREAVGRTLIFLAKEADSVTRVICGLPQELK